MFDYSNNSLNLHTYCRWHTTCDNINYLNIYKMAYRITEDCAACGTCLPECPVGAIAEGDIYTIDPNACIDCGTCADACPMGAIVAGE